MTEHAPSPDPPPPDQAARERIKNDLGSTLFVEAGAGSGKTSSLVGRVLALVVSGTVELGAIAAITFTEKAATELRDRVRRELERRAEEDPDQVIRDRCRTALEQLDGAAIGTLHAFAQRILTEHPVEAGLPPRVEVLDEVTSAVAFEHRWSMCRDQILADPTYERPILLLAAAGVRFERLRAVARTFNDNWDLVAERLEAEAPAPPQVKTLLVPILRDIDDLCLEQCRDPEDKLRLRLDEIARYVAELRTIEDEIDLFEALMPVNGGRRPSFKVGNVGKKDNWGHAGGVRERVADAGDALDAVVTEVGSACATCLGAEIGRATIEDAAERRRAGRLEFHDLLVLARSLLSDSDDGPQVRARLHDRYQRLLLDEFQDTDPIQVELAVRIAAIDPAGAAAGIAPWDTVAVEPGRLFFVGDPKQSIYRFRRADISTFMGAGERFGADGGGKVMLTANFRTAEPVLTWVNTVFDALMGEAVGDGVPDSQPPYVALDATRQAAPDGPAVALLGRMTHDRKTAADDIRAIEAEEVAATVARAVSEGWAVEDAPGEWRRARLGDVTVLVPARTSLPFLEDAFDQAGIAFRTESSSLVYASRAVRDVLMVLRAVDDPTNYLHVVSALRTPLLACGDDDLFRFKVERNGSWSYLHEQPPTVPDEDPVATGLAYLRALYDERHWHAPSEMLTQIVRDRRALELGFAEGRPRDVWRRLRFVIDQARSWSEATGGNLREYLSWIDTQTEEGTRVTVAVLPETDDDAVRIMTIHSAKGLEFPITVVSGMSTSPQTRRSAVEVVFPPNEGVGYRLGRSVTTEDYESWAPIDEQMGLHERIRLLYVACTRARDHLVVSLHRKERSSAPERHNRTNAELLLDGIGAGLVTLPDAVEESEERSVLVASAPTPAPPPMSFDEWQRERTAYLERASVPTTVSATALTDEGERDVEAEPEDPGLAKSPRDLDLPPWLKGRYGTGVGRAVHGVLQTIDLATGEGLDDAVASQCEAEAVTDRVRQVRELVQHALGSPSVRAAAASEYWRELYVCVPVDGRLLEGYIDLLYRGPEGLVVVDYKTASTSDAAELARRVDGYRVQGASYALSVGASVGEPVTKVVFVFLTPEGAMEMVLDDLSAAVSSVEELVTAPGSPGASG